MPRAELEAEEILERARQARAPLVGRHARQRRVVDEDRARRRLVHLREQLDQRRLAGAVLADDGDDRARRQRQRHVVEHEPRRARIGERHVVEADARRAARSARAGRPTRRTTPRSPRATRAAASRPSRSRAGIRSRRRSRRCTPTAARPRRAPAAPRPAGAPSPTRRRRPRRRTRAPKTAHASVCHTAEPHARLPTRAVPALPRRAALGDQSLADAGDAHFLARRRGRRDREQVARQAAGLRAALLRRALDRRAARSRSAPSAARRPPAAPARDESTPAARSSRRAAGSTRHVENSDMYMWSSTNTWLRSIDSRSRYSGRSWCAIVATDACSLRDVRLERDRHLVAEAPLHARADGAQEPGRRRRTRRGRSPQPRAAAGPMLEHAVAEQHQPQREQRVGQRRELRQHERRQHQPRLVPVAELAQPPHRRQRRRQRRDRMLPMRQRLASGEDVIGRALLVFRR